MMKKIKTIPIKFLFITILVIMSFFIAKKLFIFAMLTLLGAVFGYYHDFVNKTAIDFRLTFVLGIIITRHYGLLYTVVFFISSQIIPTIIAGGRIDGPTIVFYFEYFVFYGLVLLFPYVDIIILGIILVSIEVIFGFFINGFLGVPWIMSFFASFIALVMRIIYFLTLGRLIEFVFTLV